MPKFIRDILNNHFGIPANKARLGDQIYALQRGLQEASTDPFTNTQVPSGIGFSSDSVYGFATGTATGTVATAGTAVNTNAVAWPRKPTNWSVEGPVGAAVASVTYSGGEVTFSVNASAAGTVTVTFS